MSRDPREALPEQFFDPYLICHHPSFTELVAELMAAAVPLRRRRRRATEIRALQRIVSAVTANLARTVLSGAVLAVPLNRRQGKQTRYTVRGFRQLPDVIAQLDRAGMLRLNKSNRVGRVSTVEPAEPFRLMLSALAPDMNRSMFRKLPGEEIVLLCQSDVDWRTRQRDSIEIDYRDTAETALLREQMRRVNTFLAEADIAYVGPATDSRGRLIDLSPPARFLQRVFNIPRDCYPVREEDKRFDRGGRLYHKGVGWQGLTSELRQFIRIDGGPVAYLDFKSMFLRLAYAEAGIEPPAGDLYRRVPGIVTRDHRDAIKVVVSAMLFAPGPLLALPRGDRAAGPKQLLPPELATAYAARRAILSAFPEIAEVFEKGRGLELMYTESRLMVAILLRLAEYGIAALPIHDGLMAARSKAAQAEAIIEEVTITITGFALPLERKDTSGDHGVSPQHPRDHHELPEVYTSVDTGVGDI